LRDAFLADYRTNGRKSLVRLRDGTETVFGLNHLDKFFRGCRVADITTDHIRAFTEMRQKAKVSNASVNRSLAALRRMLNLALQGRKLDAQDVPHVPMLKEPPARSGFLEYSDYQKLRDALPEHLKPVLTVGYYTGMRLGEILSLRPQQVDLMADEILLDPGTTKNDDPRNVPLVGELAETVKMQALRRRAECPELPLLFFHKGRRMSDSTLRKPWIKACVKVGLGSAPVDERGRIQYIGYQGLTFHDLRRTGVRNLIRAGVPEVVAMRITGHKTRAVFDRYNITSGRDLKDAASKLEAYISDQRAQQVGEPVEASTQRPN
jgi:integrase